MCGQFVDPMQFSFEGQAYFSLLQKKFRRWKLNIPTNHMRTKECIIDSSNSISKPLDPGIFHFLHIIMRNNNSNISVF